MCNQWPGPYSDLYPGGAVFFYKQRLVAVFKLIKPLKVIFSGWQLPLPTLPHPHYGGYIHGSHRPLMECWGDLEGGTLHWQLCLIIKLERILFLGFFNVKKGVFFITGVGSVGGGGGKGTFLIAGQWYVCAPPPPPPLLTPHFHFPLELYV